MKFLTAVLCFIATWLFAVGHGDAMTPLKRRCILIDATRFYVEVAQTPAQQRQGLQFRTHLGENEGMMFPYAEPRMQTFWMKDCKIPLDLLFFRHGVLVNYVDEAPPCQVPADQCPRYASQVPADMVVELRAGSRKQHGFATHKTRMSVCPSL